MPVKKNPASTQKTAKKSAAQWVKTPKEKFKDFQADAKIVLQQAEKEKNLRSIVGYMTIIGWFIAYFGITSQNNEYELFHLRQALGLHVTIFICEILQFILFPILPLLWIMYIVALIIYALRAREEQRSEIPYLGAKFQEWFSFL